MRGIRIYSKQLSGVLRYIFDMSIVIYLALVVDSTEFQCILMISSPAVSVLIFPVQLVMRFPIAVNRVRLGTDLSGL